MSQNICVVGSGVMGLSCAVCLQDSLPDASITIVADRFSPDTTSDGSGGFWEPHFVSDSQTSDIRRWGQITFDHLLQLSRSSEAGTLGAQLVSGYNFIQETADKQNPDWKNTVLGYRSLTEKEAKTIYPYAKGGTAYTTVMIDVKQYLPWLMDKFKLRGGKTKHHRLQSLDELETGYDIIVNCSGLGAKQLVEDITVQPIRGQLIVVHAPWVKHFYLSFDGTDIINILPGVHGVILGGTSQKGNWNTDVSLSDRARIWSGCLKMIPGLKNAKVIRDWVGLRPFRPSVRLQQERVVSQNGNTQTVIHNYGHGGSGITLHWGCALDVVQLVKDALKTSTSPGSKL